MLLVSTGPLLLRWFSGANPGRSPYRFFALSNAASLLGLASYPFVIEPIMGLRHQAVARQLGLRMVQVDSPGHFETGTRNDSWVILGPPGHPIFDVPRLAAAVTE